MKKRFLAAIIVGVMLVRPVFASDADILLDVAQPEEDSIIVSEDSYELESDEVALEPEEEAEQLETVSSDAVSYEEDLLATEEATSKKVAPLPAEGKADFKYFRQSKYRCADGYNLIEVYIRDSDGWYIGRTFFVYKEDSGEWVKYNTRSELMAETFLCGYHREGDLLVPLAESEEGQEVWQEDNPATKIDESRIPVIMEDDFPGTPYWKDEIPFVKSGSSYEYAGGDAESPEPELDPGYKDDTFDHYSSVSFEVNGTMYYVAWTEKVQYDGKSHVWTETPRVNQTKQTADVTVRVYRSGAMINPNSYSVAFKNNINVTAFNSTDVQPSFNISLKGKYRKDNAKMSKERFGFDITPCPIDQGSLQVKKLVIEDGEKVSWTNLFFVFDDGRKIALSKHDYKKNTAGTAAIEVLNGSIWITGYNNFTGMIEMSLESPKKVTYEF